jgi:hypothetical protein
MPAVAEHPRHSGTHGTSRPDQQNSHKI